MSRSELIRSVWNEIPEMLGIGLDSLMGSIRGNKPAGESIRYDPIYDRIKEARREDDPSLAQGIWEHDLKKADWDEVTKLSVDALSNRSKDLQVGVWLLESLIHKHGFKGVAGGCAVIEQLCDRYWDELYPEIEDGDIEYRTNPISWANEKLIPALRLVPITQAGKGERELNWADWESAVQMERYAAAKNSTINTSENPITTEVFFSYVDATEDAFYIELEMNLAQAAVSVNSLRERLNEKCGEHSPSINRFSELITNIHASVENILKDRGIDIHAVQAVDDSNDEEGGDFYSSDDVGGYGSGGGGYSAAGGGGDSGSGPIRSREEAYARLAEASEYLMKVEPHSPAPYLVSRAIAWGSMTTDQLYRELFVEHQGQLSIFDILGINNDLNK